MSAYCFGKVMSDDCELVKVKLWQLASDSDVEVRFGLHEPEDNDIFDESAQLRGDGLVLNLFTPGEPDVTTLYGEATAKGQKAIRELLGESSLPYSWEQARTLMLPAQVYDVLLGTRFGRFVGGLVNIEEAKSTGFAIFDNGVEQIIEETATNCLCLILRSLLLPWDLSPSALFVWKHEETRTA